MTGLNLGLLDRLYGQTADTTIRHNLLGHQEFRRLCAGIGELQRELRESASRPDTYWDLLIRTAKRFRFDALAAPLSFSRIELPTPVSSLRSHYAHCGAVYPRLTALVHQILDGLQGLSANNEAPLLEAAVKSVAARASDQTAVVLCEARFIPAVQETLSRVPGLSQVRVLNQIQLRQDVWYDHILLFGAPYWYNDHVFRAARSGLIDVFRYMWVSGKVPTAGLFTAPIAASSPPTQVGDNTDESPDVLDSGEFPASAWLTDSALAVLVNEAERDTVNEPGRDTVQARPFLLEGDRAVFLETEGNPTALVLDLSEGEEERLQRLPVDDIAEGMYVLLRAAGGGDYVVPVADALLGPKAKEVRRMQQDWKNRLRGEVRVSSLFEVSVRLLDLGSIKANEANVRHWMWDRSIRPSNRADFHAILKLVGLDGEVDRYWRAMATIDAAHLRAGQVIRRALLAQVRKADLSVLERAGSMEFDLPGEDTGRMLAARVTQVGRATVQISAARLGRLIDTAGS